MTNYILKLVLAIGLLISSSANLLAVKNDYTQNKHTNTAACTDARDTIHSIETKTAQEPLASQKITPKKLTLMQRIKQQYKAFMAQSFMRKFMTGITATSASAYAGYKLYIAQEANKEKIRIAAQQAAAGREQAEQTRLAEIERARLAQIERQNRIAHATEQIIEAALNGDCEKVRECLAQEASVDTCDENGETLLHVAIQRRNSPLVTILLEHNATVDIKNNREQTPLALAVRPYQIMNEYIIKALLAHGAKRQPLIDALKIAISKNDFPQALKLFQNITPTDIRTAHYDDTHLWLLFIATHHSQIPIIKALLNHYPNIVNMTDEYGNTPLEIALNTLKLSNLSLETNTRLDTIQLLLLHGANRRPLIPALRSVLKVKNNSLLIKELLQLIIADDITNIDDSDCLSLLLSTARYGVYRLTGPLFARCSDDDISNTTEENCRSIFPIAALYGRDTLLQTLIARFPDIINTQGKDALSSAVYSGKAETIKILLHHGAPYTPSLLKDAISNNYVAIVQVLIDHKVNINEFNMNDNTTPLMMAAWYGHIECAELLLHHGAHIDALSKNGRTALFQAVLPSIAPKYLPMVHLLLTKGASVDTGLHSKERKDYEDKWISTTIPLIVAINMENIIATQMLILAGADINKTAEGKKTLAKASPEIRAIIDETQKVHDQLIGLNSIPLHLALDDSMIHLVQLELVRRQHRKQANSNALKFLQKNETFTDISLPTGVDALICDYADVTLYDHEINQHAPANGELHVVNQHAPANGELVDSTKEYTATCAMQ